MWNRQTQIRKVVGACSKYPWSKTYYTGTAISCTPVSVIITPPFSEVLKHIPMGNSSDLTGTIYMLKIMYVLKYCDESGPINGCIVEC